MQHNDGNSDDETTGLYVAQSDLLVGGLSVEAMLEEMGETPGGGTTCAVCQEAPVTHRTHCGHYIHARCLQPWLARSDKCPVCRAPLPLTCRATWTHNAPPAASAQQIRRASCRERV